MAKFNILPYDMTLYSPQEPKGRVFLAGDQWPGDAWSDKPGGEPAGKKTAAAAVEDLAEARGQVESLQGMVERLQHDLAQQAKVAEEAEAKVADAEQRATDAETAARNAVEDAAGITGERDRLAEVETQLRARIGSLEAEAAKVPGLLDQLNAANQALADANTALAAAQAEVAKVDPDGNGKVGGSKKAAAKAENPAADADPASAT